MTQFQRPIVVLLLILLPCTLITQSQAHVSRKCAAIQDAEQELRGAAMELVRCASTYDPSDSCDSNFNNVKDAHDDLEQVMSNAEGDCE
ncbi:hypothetical protein GCM10007863_05610 [Dyella mobilis]|nr:hypothetical protein GCM10007863_05610 [Dyella mobilis]